MGVPLHRARALPTIILPSSCGNIYPFSSSLRPRDSSRVQPFPSIFPRLLPPDLGCSARYRLKQSLLSLFPAFCLAKGLHNSLIAFFFCCGWTRATLTVCCDLFVPDLINTNAIRSLCRHATGTFPVSLHIYYHLRPVHAPLYCSFPLSLSVLALKKPVHYCDSWSSHCPSTKLPFIWIADVGRPHPRRSREDAL